MVLRPFALACMCLLLACARRTGEADRAPPPGDINVCTQDAMVCPDGSSVGRSGPNCEFAPCPGGGPGGSAGDQPPGASALKECPGECTGPRMLAPNFTCPDGKTVSGPVCADLGGGKCEWQMRSCPE